MNGTEWTESGRGATCGQLIDAAIDFYAAPEHPAMAHVRSLAARDSSRHIDCVMDWDRETNLRLTGEPLTAEDLKRIEQCEVTR
jgi:hypothetical protein